MTSSMTQTSSIVRTRFARRLRRSPSLRRGVACVEAAFCLPVILLVVLGSVEVTNKIFLKQSLSTAAYEACRSAIQASTTTAASRTAGEEILKARNVRSATIVFNPADVSNAPRGQMIRVTVSASGKANSILNNEFTVAGDVSSTVVMMKE
jgi:Flp pilus assembly protein TadG